MRTSFLSLPLALLIAGAGCGDSTSSTGSGGSGGGGGEDPTTSPSSSSASTTASSADASSSSGSGDGGGGAGPGVGGAGGEGQGGGGQGGSGQGGGGTGGGSQVCPDILVTEVSDDVCEVDADLTDPFADEALCGDVDTIWPVQVFEIEVAEGDCVSIRADNVGSLGADLFASIIDPTGLNIVPDDDFDCAVENPDGYSCPEGALTMSAAGTAYLFVGAYVDEASEACPLGESTPYEVSASINGTDLDLSSGPVCTGDLFEIIPEG
jgi:hypothetical protein